MLDHCEKILLPDYDNPPVVETVLGMQFDPLPKFRNAHLGAFWKSLDQDEWPTVTDAPARPPQFEAFGETNWAQAAWQFRFEKSPATRLRIANDRGDRMIQLENGRLHLNWMRRADEGYPRYPNLREELQKTLRRLLEFAERERLGDIKPNQWEVTYLNRIPKGNYLNRTPEASVWQTPADFGFFRPLGAMPTINGLIDAERFDGEWHFVIPEQRGRLHVKWQHARRSVAGGENGTNEEVIHLTLTARGRPMPQSEDHSAAVLEGIDLGRRTIVCGFSQLMSHEANEYWGLKDAHD